ncbi:MAG: single-stranded DNA-binding protein [Bacteroidia bacterium]
MNTMRNKVTLIGNLGNAPEVKTFEGDKKMARVSLATSETYKNKKGERVTDTTWHTVVAWGSLVNILEKYTQKGSEIAIEGKLVNRNYTDKEGIKRYTTEIHMSDLLLLGGK